MWALFLIAAVAAGTYAVYKLFRLVWDWLMERLRKKQLEEHAKQFLVITIRKLIDESRNTLSLDDLENLAELERERKTHFIFGTDADGRMVGNVDMIEACEVDDKIRGHLERGDGHVVI